MAGLGYKAFSGGAVLTAAQVQGYLQDQAVMKFATAAARDSALPSPSEGMVCYLADSSGMFAYDGGSWSIVPVRQTFVSSAAYTIPSATAALQNIYAASGSGVTLVAGMSYEVSGTLRVYFGMNGGTSLRALAALTYSGTATSSYIEFMAASNTVGWNFATSVGSPTAPNQTVGSVPVSTNQEVTWDQSGAGRNVYLTVNFSGIIRTSSGGVLTPQLGFTNNSNLVTTTVQSQANSYFTVVPIGSSTMTSAGAWS